MNQSRFPIIFHQIMWMRKSGRKFLSRALCLITDKGDVQTHGNYYLTPLVVFLYLPPLLKLDFGLWARVSPAVLLYPEPTILFSYCSAVSHAKTRDFRLPEPAIVFSTWSAVSHPKTRDFRFRSWRHHYIKTRHSLPYEPTLLLQYSI